jgi:hypothetical protein
VGHRASVPAQLTEAFDDLGFHIVQFDKLGSTFVELLRSADQLVIPCLVDQRLVVTFKVAQSQLGSWHLSSRLHSGR